MVGFTAQLVGVLSLLSLVMPKRLVSTTVRLEEKAYYMSPHPVVGHSTENTFGAGQLTEPCTVISVECETLSPAIIGKTFDHFASVDDVWSPPFKENLVIRTSSKCSVAQDFADSLRDHGVLHVHLSTGDDNLPQGPYFLNHGQLHQAYLLYPDTAGAFVVATVPASPSDGYRSLDAAAYGEEYPAALTIAVPSRLSYNKTASQPYAGMRIAIKDIIDLKGLKTGASSRAFTSLRPVRENNAAIVQHLIDLGCVIVGKTKTTQFADSEWATDDWVDYHPPFNPAGDGYLTPSGSSSGSAAATASYHWLDFTLGSDSLGSIRAPAAAQGIFGMRSSLGAASFDGILPYSPHFDTVGGFARTAQEFSLLAKALYDSPTESRSSLVEKPRKLLYPTEYWPVKDPNSQIVFDKFIQRLEEYLGIKRTPVNLEELWEMHRPDDVTETLSDYMEHVFEWGAHPDQWNKFLKGFIEDYERTMGKPPILNPELRFKQAFLPTITDKQQAEALRRLEIYRTWFYEHVMLVPATPQAVLDTLLILPWTTGEPDYRDKYRAGPQNFTGSGYFFYNIATYAQAPEIIVPVGSTSYVSKYTGHTEDLPAAVGIMAAKGSDIMLADLVSDLFDHEELIENHQQGTVQEVLEL